MISTNIDLTERGDFSSQRHTYIPVIDSSIRIDELIDSRSMSVDEYNVIAAYENIFGRKRHFTDAIEVFRRSDYEWRMEMKDHCQRCGKYFKIPWKKKNDLCPECDKVYLYILGERRAPWKQEVVGNRKDDRDFLRLR